MLREEQNPNSHLNPPCFYWIFFPYFLQSSSKEGQERIWRSNPQQFWLGDSTTAGHCWLGRSVYLREIIGEVSSSHSELQPRLEKPPQHQPFYEDYSQFSLAGKEEFWAESGDKSMTLPKDKVCWWHRDDSAGASWASGSGGDKHPHPPPRPDSNFWHCHGRIHLTGLEGRNGALELALLLPLWQILEGWEQHLFRLFEDARDELMSSHSQVVWELQECASEMGFHPSACQTTARIVFSPPSCPSAPKRKAPRWKRKELAKAQHVLVGNYVGDEENVQRKYPKILTLQCGIRTTVLCCSFSEQRIFFPPVLVWTCICQGKLELHLEWRM